MSYGDDTPMPQDRVLTMIEKADRILNEMRSEAAKRLEVARVEYNEAARRLDEATRDNEMIARAYDALNGERETKIMGGVMANPYAADKSLDDGPYKGNR